MHVRNSRSFVFWHQCRRVLHSRRTLKCCAQGSKRFGGNGSSSLCSGTPAQALVSITPLLLLLGALPHPLVLGGLRLVPALVPAHRSRGRMARDAHVITAPAACRRARDAAGEPAGRTRRAPATGRSPPRVPPVEALGVPLALAAFPEAGLPPRGRRCGGRQLLAAPLALRRHRLLERAVAAHLGQVGAAAPPREAQLGGWRMVALTRRSQGNSGGGGRAEHRAPAAAGPAGPAGHLPCSWPTSGRGRWPPRDTGHTGTACTAV